MICLEKFLLTRNTISVSCTVLYYWSSFRSLNLPIKSTQDWRTGIEMTSTATYGILWLITWDVLFPKTSFECVSSFIFLLDLRHYVVPLLLFYWSWFTSSSSCCTVLYPVFYVCISNWRCPLLFTLKTGMFASWFILIYTWLSRSQDISLLATMASRLEWRSIWYYGVCTSLIYT